MKYYKTIKAARNQLALDCGYDPLPTRATIAVLSSLGYCVDRARAEHRERLERNPKAKTEPRFHLECDEGHKWTATEAEDFAAGHRCPVCGGYWQ